MSDVPIYVAAPAMVLIGALDSSLLSLPEINDYLVVAPAQATARGIVTTDDRGIDAVADGSGEALAGLSGLVRRSQTGYARSYALTIIVGVLLLAAAMYLGHLA